MCLKIQKQIVKLSVSQKLEYQKLLSQSTEGLYENILKLILPIIELVVKMRIDIFMNLD